MGFNETLAQAQHDAEKKENDDETGSSAHKSVPGSEFPESDKVARKGRLTAILANQGSGTKL